MENFESVEGRDGRFPFGLPVIGFSSLRSIMVLHLVAFLLDVFLNLLPLCAAVHKDFFHTGVG